jgi:hypothetical protein
LAVLKKSVKAAAPSTRTAAPVKQPYLDRAAAQRGAALRLWVPETRPMTLTWAFITGQRQARSP